MMYVFVYTDVNVLCWCSRWCLLMYLIVQRFMVELLQNKNVNLSVGRWPGVYMYVCQQCQCERQFQFEWVSESVCIRPFMSAPNKGTRYIYIHIRCVGWFGMDCARSKSGCGRGVVLCWGVRNENAMAAPWRFRYEWTFWCHPFSSWLYSLKLYRLWKI